ncbi:MAG: BlaI/MecI/CopY family transcriptional regulator [Acidimicrobiales bacterium]
MDADTTCENPMCACTPCTCAECRCGVARLGELERRVMDTLWAERDRELTGRDVTDALADYAYTTVATVLDRLVHKGLVLRRMDGRTIRFTAIGTRGAHTAVLMHEALAADRDPHAALARFAETLSTPEASVLRRALETVDRRSPRAGR